MEAEIATVQAAELSASGDTPRAHASGRGPLPTTLETGERLDRYLILQRLGAGGMGVVYAAYDPELDRKVAIKLLHGRTDPGADASEGQRRLLREARAMAQLSHRNVVMVHDVGEHRGRVFIAMEFLEGQTLRAFVRDRHPRARELVEVCRAAGEGLAAAHALGMVHCDFKPDNVMVCSDGRVCVLDFGLARARGPQAKVAPTSASVDLERSATAGLAGTPAYMAPEQFAGREVTAASDQFAFCVTLYEALYGQRPFAGDNLASLSLAVTAGSLQRPPPGAGVPSWLREIVVRGLHRDPTRRWPSMRALLDALGRNPTRRRVAAAAALTALGLVVGLAAAHQWRRDQAEAACARLGEELERPWRSAARERVEGGLQRVAVPYARQAATATVGWLDRWVEGWSTTRAQLCREREVTRTRDVIASARAEDCLYEARDSFDALLEELASADAAVAERSASAAAALPRVADCLDARHLQTTPALPDDPELRARVVAARRQLAAAEALVLAGRYAQALARAEEQLAAAEVDAWPALAARARRVMADARGRLGDYDDAEALDTEVYFAAGDLDDPGLAFTAATAQVFTVGYNLRRTDEGLRWARHARMMARRAEIADDDPRTADLLDHLGKIYRVRGALAEARDHHARALAAREAHLGAGHPDVATSLNNLGIVLDLEGDYDGAARHYQRALELWEAALGPEHPRVSIALNNLGKLHVARGEFDAAASLLTRALAIDEASYGPGSPEICEVLNNLANLHAARGEYEAAIANLERAASILEAALGPTHVDLASPLNNLGMIHHLRGELEEAVAFYRRALAINVAALGPQHADVASTRSNLGDALRELGRVDEAAEQLSLALETREEALGPTHPGLAYTLVAVAEIALIRESYADARAAAERALAIREASDARPPLIAEARYALARALWGLGDAASARAQARAAVAAYPDDDPDGAAVRSWLAARGGS